MRKIAILGALLVIGLGLTPARADVWGYQEQEDPFTDESSAFVFSLGKEGSAVLIKCENKESMFLAIKFNYVDFDLDGAVTLRTRVDKNPPQTYSGFFTGDLYVVAEPGSLVLARELMTAETFAASNGDDTRVFDLSGGEEISKVLSFCGHAPN